jgi:hypothetical protein
MDYLTGKFLKATKYLNLAYRVVDGQLYSESSIYSPEIYSGQYLKVLSVKKDFVILQNLSSNDWQTCELTLDDIEEFKIVSKDEILDAQ